ncbi:MAG: FAD/NAD(P)-binding protein [Candidatus Omnitrophica bacterium]|nr:FAD/NAD(P)-binding protein [Candidatus Omnitrophota bacterium]
MRLDPYQPIPSRVIDIIEETPTIKTFVLKPQEQVAFSTGQFVELTLPGEGEAPFTPSSDPHIKEELEVTIMKAGRVTSALHSIPKDTTLGIRGPYGKGYPLEEFKNKDILIVGGGVGLAPLRSLIYALLAHPQDYKNIIIRYGARTPQDLLYKKQLSEWAKIKNINLMLTVDTADSNWKGNVGVVTTILKDLPLDLTNAVAVVCGPPIMMKFTTLKLLDLGFRPESIYLSMEKNMSCGLGKCGHCRLGRFYVCKDGPVFKYEEIKEIEDIWE